MVTQLRDEYPRPDLLRHEWQSLNGEWQFSYGTNMSNKPADVSFHQTIRVPFAPQSGLSGIGDALNIAPVVWYRREFSIPDSWIKQHVKLHFGAVDYEIVVWVNGYYVGSHRGGYTPFSFDIHEYLRSGRNEIIVKVLDENRVSQPRGKQSANLENWGCWYTRVTGIWQSVWLEPVSKLHISGLRLIPDIDRECAIVAYELSQMADGLEVEAVMSSEGTEVYRSRCAIPARHRSNCDLIPRTDGRIVLPVPKPKLWSPEEPNLYDLCITLIRDGRTVDVVRTYLGMRKVEARGNRIYLNNKPYYLRMVLNQGYWPDGVYTPGSVGDFLQDVTFIKEAGFNGVRMHQKIEDPHFYHYCDTQGLLVWAEMPSCYVYGDESILNITSEWQQVVCRLFNFPSIMAWVSMNESWGVEQLRYRTALDPRPRHHLDALYHAVKALDPTRLVISNDGWQSGITDIISIHDYVQTGEGLRRNYDRFKSDRKAACFTPGLPVMLPEYEYQGQPILITEYGGIKVESPDTDGWGYGRSARDVTEMLGRIRELTDTILGEPEIAGYCYTQLTDVYQETNGLMSFDRVSKAPVEEYARIFGRNLPEHT